MSARQRILLVAVSLLLVGCTVATTAPTSRDTVDNPGQTPMKDSL